jgi:hypothetical protein
MTRYNKERVMNPATDGDELVPDPQVCREFHISYMTLYRWSRDPDLGFAPAIKIRRRNFRSRRRLEEFKQRVARSAELVAATEAP